MGSETSETRLEKELSMGIGGIPASLGRASISRQLLHGSTRHVGTVHHCHSYNITVYIEVQVLLLTCLCNRDQTLCLVKVRRVSYDFNLCSIVFFRLGQQRYPSVFAERLQRNVSSVSRTFEVPIVRPRMFSTK